MRECLCPRKHPLAFWQAESRSLPLSLPLPCEEGSDTPLTQGSAQHCALQLDTAQAGHTVVGEVQIGEREGGGGGEGRLEREGGVRKVTRRVEMWGNMHM